MDSFRFIYPGAEGKEPDASPLAENPNAKVYVPDSGREERDIVRSDYLGKDGRGDGTITDLSSHAYRPNHRALEAETLSQIRVFIESREEVYRAMVREDLVGGSRDIYARAAESVRDGIFKEMYAHVADPLASDLRQSFTAERIRAELEALLDRRS